MPGVPDFYQGNEVWDLSLVDPDNRRPVDFKGRAESLESLDDANWQSIVGKWRDGRIKVALTHHLLTLRAELADVFTRRDMTRSRRTGSGSDRVRPTPGSAVLVAIGYSFATPTYNGRTWPIRANCRRVQIDTSSLPIGRNGRIASTIWVCELPRCDLVPRRALAAMRRPPGIASPTIFAFVVAATRSVPSAHPISQAQSLITGPEGYRSHAPDQLAFGQQQLAAVLDRDLRDLRKRCNSHGRVTSTRT